MVNRAFPEVPKPSILARIDPYGYLVLDGEQASALLDEWPLLGNLAQDDAEKHVLDGAEQLIRRCAEHPSDHHLHS